MKKKLRHFLSIFVVVGAVGFVSEPVLAQVVTNNFTGAITSVSGTLFGLTPSVGQQVQGNIIYDSSLPPAFDTGAVAGYIQPLPSGLSVAIGDATVTNDGVASLQVINDFNLSVANPCRNLQGALR